MVLTPTYYVYEMYKVHHDAALIPINIETPMYQFDGKSVPAISASASKDKAGKIHITLVNVNPDSDVEVNCDFRGENKKINVTGTKIITAKDLNSYNTFENPNVVVSGDFNKYKMNNNLLSIKMPSKSVVMIELD